MSPMLVAVCVVALLFVVALVKTRPPPPRAELKEGALPRTPYEPCLSDPTYDEVVAAFGVERARAAAYFRIIESMERQRDQYKLLWLEQGRAHAAAQELYERELGRARQVALRAIDLINDAAKKTGVRPVKHPFELLSPPVGLVNEYRKAIEEHIAALPTDIDGTLARQRITESASPPPEEASR